MAEIKQQNTVSPGGKEETLSPVAAPSTPHKPASKGEKIYNWAVYKGVNYWANLIGSIAIADYFTHGHGRSKLDAMIRPAAKGLHSSGLIKNPQTAYKQTKTAFETGMLLSGGWLLLIPMKLLEDNKRPVVHWLNKKSGVAEVDKDGKELGPDQIHLEQEQPKQTWMNVFKRRIIATVTIMGVGNMLEHVAKHPTKTKELQYRFNGQHYHETVPLGGKENVTNIAVDRLNKLGNAVAGKEKFGKDLNSVGQRWLNIGILDSVFTAITAGIMYVTNGAKKANQTNNEAPTTQKEPNGQPTTPAEEAKAKENLADKVTRKKEGSNKDDLTYVQRVLDSQGAALQQSL